MSLAIVSISDRKRPVGSLDHEQSPAHASLLKAQEELKALEQRRATLADAVSRLRSTEDAASAPAAELAELEAEESAAMQEWARRGAGEPPRQDPERRRRIEEAVALNAAKATAARDAAVALEGELASVHVEMASARVRVEAAAAGILEEHASAILDQVEQSAPDQSIRLAVAASLADLLVEHANPDGRSATIDQALLGRAIRMRERVVSIHRSFWPSIERPGELRRDWEAFWSGLVADPTATPGGSVAASMKGNQND